MDYIIEVQNATKKINDKILLDDGGVEETRKLLLKLREQGKMSIVQTAKQQ